jgi:hypothetical protein
MTGVQGLPGEYKNLDNKVGWMHLYLAILLANAPHSQPCPSQQFSS